MDVDGKTERLAASSVTDFLGDQGEFPGCRQLVLVFADMPSLICVLVQ